MRENFARLVFNQSCSLFLIVVSFKLRIISLILSFNAATSPDASTLIERVKSDCWLEWKASGTPSAAFELAADLLQYARALRPDWPNTAEREADLAAHIHVAGLLQRASQLQPR